MALFLNMRISYPSGSCFQGFKKKSLGPLGFISTILDHPALLFLLRNHAQVHDTKTWRGVAERDAANQ